MTLFKIAFRNVLKNRRRSLITVMAIAFGYMAVAMFKGYTHNSYEKIALGAVFLEAPGHLVIFKKGYLDEGRVDPEKYLFSAEDLETVRSVLSARGDVLWSAPKLTLAGLVTNGDISTVFLADAMDPAEEARLWNFFSSDRFEFQPTLLPTDDPAAAFLAPKLAGLLDLSPGDTAVLMTTTLYGQMNAVDIDVAGTVPTISDAMDDKFIKLPLGLARQLYDFDGADRVCVLLRDRGGTDRVRAELAEALAQAGLPVDIRTWAELSLYYQKVRNYLDVVFLFLFSIVMIIVVMGTFNTMSMAVFERFREVGTLRAIGLKPRRVVQMFALEGAILGAAGSAAGMLLALAGYALLRVARLSYQPPGIAGRVTVEVDLVPDVLGLTLLFFTALAVLAATLPARRAARASIVDALGHV